MKPYFLPLRKVWFNAFRDGLKTTEYRLAGTRYESIKSGRIITLSCGYSGAQLQAECVSIEKMSIENCPTECLSVYPAGSILLAIHLKVKPSKQTCMNIA